MSDDPLPQSEIILYQTEDGRTRIQCRFEYETLWLSQALIAELFQKDVRTINEHLVNIFEEGELRREATIRKFRIVRQEGARGQTGVRLHFTRRARQWHAQLLPLRKQGGEAGRLRAVGSRPGERRRAAPGGRAVGRG